eukprot:XP_001709925.1 Hypothetical protein GL50803_37853 [Giardia lamblia ATCC 50803]
MILLTLQRCLLPELEDADQTLEQFVLRHPVGEVAF